MWWWWWCEEAWETSKWQWWGRLGPVTGGLPEKLAAFPLEVSKFWDGWCCREGVWEGGDGVMGSVVVAGGCDEVEV